MKKALIAATVAAFVLSLVATPVLADGAKFLRFDLMHRDLYQSAQRAVIMHGDSTGNMTQHLILSVQFVGDAEEFAWVVPVPAIPVIDVTDAEVFAELSDFTVQAIPEPRGGGCSPVPMDPSDRVDVIDEQVVGPYATATLSAEDPNALVDWLNDNNYYFPEEGYEVIAEYIEKNWYFVATRINAVDEATGEALAEGSIEPIVFSFASDGIVYPLRITALNAATTEVLLYVFADEIVVPEQYPFRIGYGYWKTNAFLMEYGQKVFTEDFSEYEILAELLSTYLSGGEFYLTKLRGRISADLMVDIDLTEYRGEYPLPSLTAMDDLNGGDIMVLAIIILPVMGLYFWRRYQRGV